MTVRYSEIFYSFQGEAEYAGVPAVWLRFFGCNLNCHGFGQKNPTDPSTYELPYQDFDLTEIKRVEDLPVWKTGCDSSYSWSAKYRHLAHSGTPLEVAQRMIDANKSEHNPEGRWIHPVTNQATMLCFTGGEPMLYQNNIMKIIEAMMNELGNTPHLITIETNATIHITPEFQEFLDDHIGTFSVHFAMSPKLFTVSGEKDRILPSVINQYVQNSDSAVLKFVCNGTEESWAELEEQVVNIRNGMENCMPPVWVMPVGARQEEQTSAFLGPLSIAAMRRGYNVATRNQVAVFGNVIGS